MTNLLPGAFATVNLGHGGYLIVSVSEGLASVTETQTGLSSKTTNMGPSVSRQTFGPYPDGATIRLHNQTAQLDYDFSSGQGNLLNSQILLYNNNSRRLKIVGRHFAFNGSVGATAGTDIGGTTRRVLTAISPLTQLAALLSTHFWINGGAGATEDSTTFPRNIAAHKVGFEVGGKTTKATLNGKEIIVVEPVSPLVQTDPAGVAVPAGGTFYARLYVEPGLAPSGTGTATAVAGGSLSAATYYYVITRTKNGIESSPIAEFSGTTAGGNLTLRLTWVDSRSASADYYTAYRSAAAAGTKQFLSRTSGPQKRLDDDGGYTVDSTINPPSVASNYRFNQVTYNTGDATNHINGTGDGSDQSSATGTFGNAGPAYKFGTAPQCVVGDDTSGKSVLLLGDSIGGGRGFTVTTGKYTQQINLFDLAFSDGEFNSCNASFNGSTLAELVAATQAGGGRSRLLLISYADWVIDQHGTNDLAIGATFVQLATNKLLMGRMCHARGAKFATTTISPRVTSTNNCLTVALQTQSSIEARRQQFNLWCRGGCQVDGSGAPVVSGGVPSPYIDGVIDIASAVEVDSANVLSLTGGYWLVPSTEVYSDLVLTGVPTATSLPVAGGGFGAANDHVSRVIEMTSGVRSVQVAVVASNTTTGFTVYANADTAQSGVAVTGLSGAPAANDTFRIWNVTTNEGLHPSIAGHMLLSNLVREWLAANVL